MTAVAVTSNTRIKFKLINITSNIWEERNINRKQESKIRKMPLSQDATAVWRCLNGLICVYKPRDLKIGELKRAIISNVCRDLNDLKQRDVAQRCTIQLMPTEDGNDIVLRPELVPSYADSVYAVGPRFLPKDIKVSVANHLGDRTSGVLVLGINTIGSELARSLFARREMRIFRISVRLGRATDSGWADEGRSLMRANWKHVPREAIDRVLAATQAANQRQSFLFAGVHPQSQLAFEIASKGLLKPTGPAVPLIYGARCVSYEPPDFTMEIHSIGETEQYLLQLVGEVGRRVRSASACTGIRCVRYGPFNVDVALSNIHWSIDHLIHNMQLSHQLYLDSKQIATGNAKISSS